MLTPLDFAVIAVYFIGVAAFGIWSGGKQKTTSDYFLGGRNLPWWAVCFSVVATETSTLTVISIPAIAFGGSMTFFQITFGYVLGRIIVSFLFLPRYYKGQLTTAYAYLGSRYGTRMRATAAITFLVTRLLADGVRMFATAIPIKVITDAAGLDIGYFPIIAAIGIVTVLYTLIGGIRAVVWMDVVQMAIYIGGAVVALFILLQQAPQGWLEAAGEAGKTKLLDFGTGLSLSQILTSPYVTITAVLGGAVFSMASHGTDQLIVQRLLTCRSLKDSQIALIVSGLVVMAQFLLFLFIGLLLWQYYGRVSATELGLSRADEIFPRFIVEGLPAGIAGLILAGIIAAAMSTIASSLNSLASSTIFDLYDLVRNNRSEKNDSQSLRLSRVFTFIWAAVFIGFASIFQDEKNPVVELGLAIAGYTYGGLLGVFLLGLINRRTVQADALLAFVVTIAFMTAIILGVRFAPGEGWIFLPFVKSIPATADLKVIAWPWYPVIGSLVTILVGSLVSLRHRAQ